MASKAAAAAVGGVMDISTKQTLQAKGVWELFRRAVALDKNRSNGVPLNPYFRHPAPGQNDPLGYDDPVTHPAGDIAGNPYWKRDARRNYPRLSTVTQADAVALLSVGSAAKPKGELIGEAGIQALVAATEAGQTTTLGTFLSEGGVSTAEATSSFLVNGLPPTPSGQSNKTGSWEVHKYKLTEEQSYPDKYPCRTFV